MSGLVLGLGGSNHDFSAAIIADGPIRVAIEDERIQRVKHPSGLRQAESNGVARTRRRRARSAAAAAAARGGAAVNLGRRAL
jgi:predicted NodU family carbamoyl transferase